MRVCGDVLIIAARLDDEAACLTVWNATCFEIISKDAWIVGLMRDRLRVSTVDQHNELRIERVKVSLTIRSLVWPPMQKR